MMLMVAMAAIIVPLVLLAVFRMPAKYGMSISAAVVGTLALTVWHMDATAAAASVLQGLHRALSILWILLGAMTLLKVLELTGAMERIKHAFYAVSPDMRVLAVIVGLYFVSVLEGLAGFGSPVAIAAPLLVSLGMRPMAAIVIGLLGDSIAVAFGAVGTPVLVGLSNVPGFAEPGFFTAIARLVTMIDFWIGIALPAIMVFALVRLFGETKRARAWSNVTELLPWSLMTGVVYAVAAIIYAQFMGPEFISAMSGLTALIVAIVTARVGILLPRDRAWRTHVVAHTTPRSDMSLLAACTPYLFVIGGLLLTRLVPVIRDGTMTIADISIHSILGVEGISSTWQLLYSPGTLMMVGSLIAILTLNVSNWTFLHAAKASVEILYKAAFALFPTLIMVQLFTNSGINHADLAAMPRYIAESFAEIFSGAWVVCAPFFGAVGAFIAGSSTVSTLTMAEIQYTIAELAHLPTDLVLAQQLSGAAAGNMIAVHNIIAASAVVGVYHQEGRVIRRILPFVGVYLILSVIGAVAVLALL